MSKNKLHALLSVEGDVKSQADQIMQETIKTFKDKTSHFFSSHRTYLSKEEGGTLLDPESKEMVDTVDSKLKYSQKSLVRAINLVLQKEITNTVAKADLVVGGEVLAKEIPATALLSLEGRLKAIRQMYKVIPTLPPGILWKECEGGLFETSNTKIRNEKKLDSKVLYEATEKHPAKVETFTREMPVGTWTTIEKAGVWTTARKSEVLDNLDRLLRSVKAARQRANDVLIDKNIIGKKLFEYIHGSHNDSND